MKRGLKITALVVVLIAGVLGGAVAVVLTWLVHSESASRWLLQQGLSVAPVTIEANGISGTLADGLGVESLSIELPTAKIGATQIVLSWSPASVLAGNINIKSVHIAELSVDVLASEAGGDPVEDRLFWLQLPLSIVIESGHLDKLRIDKAEFENLNLAGRIGHGRLDIDSLSGHISGFSLHASGELAGPAPGRLDAVASWEMSTENISGSGNFSGDIEELGFSQLIKLPEAVNFKGTIYDLFSSPSLAGVADWQSVRLPGETALYSKAGVATLNSDFLSARIEGNSTLALEGWPQAPMQLQALVDLNGVTIDRYSLDALGGQLTGSGRIDYDDGLQGQLSINGTQIDTGLIRAELPGQLGFDSTLLIETADTFALDVTAANAQIADTTLSGLGRVQWLGGKLAAISVNTVAGTNRLSADIHLDKKLSGAIKANAPELALLWPGLQGVMEATITLGGSPEQPLVHVIASATELSFGSQSLDTLKLNGELQANNRITGTLAATGLLANQQHLGNLDFSLNGTLAEHRSVMNLAGGVVDIQLRTSGGWDGEFLNQRFDHGKIKPDGFDSWQLQQQPELRLSAAAGQVSAHCWQQDQAGICIDASNWNAQSLQSAVVINDFALASLQPLLAEGYSIEGSVDADLKLIRGSNGLQAELQWRQSRTVLAYDDDIDEFSTVLDQVQVDLASDQSRTNLSAKLSGEQGLTMTASAMVSGPLVAESPLKAAAKGRLPSIGLLRPLLRRVVHAGELKGELTLDLSAGGTLGDPLFSGGARLVDGTLGLVGAGITLNNINITAESEGTDKLRVTGELRSGDGTASILGEVHATEEPGLEAEIRIQGQNLASVRVPELSVDTSPDLILRITEDVFDISGTLLIPSASAEIHQLSKSAVPRSSDVIVHEPERAVEQASGTIVSGNVEVLLGDDVRFRGFGLDSRLEGGLRLTQLSGGYLRSGGTVRVRDGFLTGYGRELRVDRGDLTFTGPLDDPLINIQVSRESVYEGRQYTIGLRLTGSAQNVKTEPFSRPAMSERDVLSFLLLDRPTSSDSDASGAALALGLQQLVPDQSGRFGLDEVSFETNDANQAAMVAGKRINDNLFVRYVFGSRGEPGAFRIRYTLGRGFSLEASTGSRQSLDLIYLLER